MILSVRKYLNIFLIFLIILFLYFQLTAWHNFYVGVLLFTFYFLLLTPWWQEIFHKIFGLDKKAWLAKIFSLLAIFLLLGFASSIAVVFYKLTPFLVWTRFVVVAILTFIIYKLQNKTIETEKLRNFETGDSKILFKKNIISYLLSLIYFIFWFIGLYLLYKSQSSSALQSPWQAIDRYYLPIFFVLTFLSGIFLFVKFKIKTILFILVLQSLLLHFYLPLSHENPWGGDVWRHIAIEKQISAGEQILPVLIGPNAEWQEVAEIDLPKVFFSPQKYAYGHLWGASVLLSQTLRIDLISINKWLVPIIWSLAMPFVFFRIGWLLFNSRRKGLWLAWLSFLPFPLQALGALTLPVSLGYLTFFFVLMLWLQYLRDGNRAQRNLVLFLAILMLFGYTLHFILIWLVILLSTICCLLSIKFQSTDNRYQITKKILLVVIFIASIFIFPAIEIFAKISHLPAQIDWWNNIKQVIGQFFGWFYASAIRPHDILSGNIIFNHTPDYAFVSSIFTNWRWWLVPAMMILWILVGLGIYHFRKLLVTSYQLLVLLFSTVFGGYFIGWFVLEGDRLLTRRLDAMLAFLILIFIIQGISYLLSLISYNLKLVTYKIFIIIIVLLLSWFSVFTYASGPDMRVVSADEYKAAKYIWEKTANKPLPFPPLVGEGRVGSCVLADTWVLLPLETLSAGKIIGGGFPIDYQFGQSERVKLFEEFSKNPSEELLNEANEITGAEECWFIGRLQTTDYRLQIDEIFGSEAVEIGELGVWGEGY